MTMTKLCAIINVTPDSFSDGGKFFNAQKAIDHGIELVNRGAEMLDIGGESTRPGSSPVDNQDEISRIQPVVRALSEQTDAIISVDTWKAEVAQAAIEAGAHIINDITGLIGDPKMLDVIAKADQNVKAIVMFNPPIARPNHPSSVKFRDFGGHGVFTDEEIEKMENMPIVDCMFFYFDRVFELCEKHGIDKSRLILDPGIGFALSKKENYQLIQSVELIREKGFEVFLGVSRKRFIVNTILGLDIDADPETEEGFANRDIGSAIITAFAVSKEVEYVRIHSLDEHKMAVAITSNIIHADEAEDITFDQYTNNN